MMEARSGIESKQPFGSPLHLLGLWGFAVLQPLLGVLADEPTFFIVRDSKPVDLFTFTLLVGLVAPLPLMALSLASRALGRRLHGLVHGAVVGLLLAAIFLVPAHLRLGLSPAGAVAVALGLAGAGVWLYWRAATVRQYATLLVAATPLFAAAFLFDREVRPFTFPQPVALEPLPTASTRIPVVLVVLDELPLLSLLDANGRIDPVRYPNLAALAEQGTWYPRATAAADVTHYSVPALLTGKKVDPRRTPSLRNHPQNLFTLLAGSHDLQVLESLTRLCPPELCAEERPGFRERLTRLLSDVRYVYLHILLPEPWTSTLPSLSYDWQNFGGPTGARSDVRFRDVWRNRRAMFAADRSARFLGFVDELRLDDRPPLIYLHTLLPHAPWVYLPSGDTYPTEGEPEWGGNGFWVADEAAVREWQLRHLLQVGYVDTLLGRLWRRLRELDLFEPSLIVVTADHGISFEAGRPRRRLTRGNGRDILGVPLIVKAPFQTEAVIDMRAFEAIDLLPTLSAHLGIELPWKADGLNALDPGTRALRRVSGFASHIAQGQMLTVDPRFDYQSGLDRKLALFGYGAEPLRPPPARP